MIEQKRQYSRGKLKHLLNQCSERVTPPCPHFGICGGCQQQHACSQLQQDSKADSLRRLLVNATGACPALGPVICGPEYGYRRRARLGLLYQPKQQRLQMGFHQTESHDLVSVKHCPVLRPELERLLQPLYQCLSALQAVRRLGHVELVLADNGPLLVLRHLDTLNDVDRAALTDFAQRERVAIYLAADSENLEKLVGEDPYYQIDGLRLAFHPRDFIQVNDTVNQQMVAQALAWLDVQPDERVLDLFCGMGNFTLPLAKRAREVVGVEGVAELVANGQYNAQSNALANVSFFHENLESDISRQPWATQ